MIYGGYNNLRIYWVYSDTPIDRNISWVGVKDSLYAVSCICNEKQSISAIKRNRQKVSIFVSFTKDENIIPPLSPIDWLLIYDL
jgi:hypothetical protein